MGKMPPSTLCLVLALSLFSFAASPARGVKTKYDDRDLKLNGIAKKTFSAYTKADSPVQNDNLFEPRVELDLEVKIETDWKFKSGDTWPTPGALGVLFHSDAKGSLGVEKDTGGKEYCCWDDDGCDHGIKKGDVIVDQSEVKELEGQNLIHLWPLGSLFRDPGNTSGLIKITGNVSFARTGVWRLWFILCGAEEDDGPEAGKPVDKESFGIEIDGEAHFINPFGELPGAYYGYLVVYWWLCSAYTLMIVVWGLLCYHFRENLLMYQKFLAAVVVTALVENFIFGLDYAVVRLGGFCCLLLLLFGFGFGFFFPPKVHSSKSDP
jgi:hypothetical protein